MASGDYGGRASARPPFQFLSMDFLRASLWTLYGLPHGLPHGLFYGLSTVFSTDTIRASPRFFPRARTEAGEWRRKPHVKVPSPRTAARRMSPRPFHGARQIGGKEFTRSAARARRGQRKLPQTERGVFAQARLATNCRARFPASGGRLASLVKSEGTDPRADFIFAAIL